MIGFIMAIREFDERPLLPNLHLNRKQTIACSIKITDILEIRSAFQFAFKRVGPAMIRTAHLRRMAFGLSHDRRGMMTTDIEKCPNLIVAAAHDDDWLISNVGGHVIARLLKLVDSRCYLPRMAEDRLLFQFEDTFVGVPEGGNCRGALKRRVRIVATD